MAPKPSSGPAADYEVRASNARNAEVAPAGVDAALHWRVGRRGSLKLLLRRVDRTDSLAAELRLEMRRDGRDAGDAALVGMATVEHGAEGVHRELTLGLRFTSGPEPLVASVSLLRREGSTGVVVLTDLPARLGLRGGTYLLDQASVPRIVALLDPCVVRAP